MAKAGQIVGNNSTLHKLNSPKGMYGHSQNIYKASVVTWQAVWMNGYAWQTARTHCGQDVADALPVNVDRPYRRCLFLAWH